MASTYDILIDIRSRVDSLAGTVAELRGLRGAVDQAGQSARQTTESLGGLAKAQGIQLAADFARGLARALADVVKEGVQFNATLETARLGIAGLLRNADPKQFDSFGKAVAASSKVLEQLKRAATESPASLADLTQTLQDVAGTALAAGIPIERLVGLVVRLSQIPGLNSRELPQELRALLTGDIDQNARIAKQLGITGPDVKRATARGELEKLLLDRTSGFGEASGAASQSFAVRLSNLNDVLQQLKGTATEDVFGKLRTDLGGLLTELAKPDAVTGARELGSVLRSLYDSAKLALSVGSQLGGVFSAISVLPALNAGNRADARLVGSEAQVASVEAALKGARSQAEADAARKLAITAINEELRRGGDADLQRVEVLQAMVRRFDSAQASARGLRAELQGASVNMRGLDTTAATTSANLQKLPNIISELRDKLREAALQQALFNAGSNEAQKLALLQTEQARLRAVAGADLSRVGVVPGAPAPTGGPRKTSTTLARTPGGLGIEPLPEAQEVDEVSAAFVRLAVAAADALAAPLGGGAILASEIDSQTSLANKAAASLFAQKQGELALSQQKQAADQQQLQLGIEKLKALEQEALKVGDLEKAEKARLGTQLLEEQLRQRSLGVNDPAQQAANAQQIVGAKRAVAEREASLEIDRQRLEQRLAEVANRRQLIQANNFLTANEKETKGRDLLQQQIELLIQLIALERQRASELLQGGPEDQKAGQSSLGRVQDLQAQLDTARLTQRGESFGGQLFGDLNQYLNQFGSTSQQISGILTGSIGAGIGAIKSGVSGLISGTLTWGQAFRQVGAAIIQQLIQMAIQLLIVLTLRLAIKAIPGLGALLAGGGPVGGAPVRAATGTFVSQGTTDSADDVPALLSKGEYVIRAAAVRRYGLGFFDRLNTMRAPVEEFASGGLARAAGAVRGAFGGGGAASGGSTVKVVAVSNARQAAREALLDPDMRTYIFDIQRERRVELGIVG